MDHATAALRRFNRFFTRFVGALNVDFLGVGMTLPEARLLYEIAHADGVLASALQTSLGMDAGFVSRMVRRFEERSWIERDRSAGDGRRRPIRLTLEGRHAFERLDARQRHEVEKVLARLKGAELIRLTAALRVVEELLDGRTGDLTLRPFRPGDMGVVVSRQAILYHEHYGWNAGIEANEAEVVAAFLRDFKPGREQCWIAELGGEMAGSVFLTDEGGGICRLRLLYVEAWAQGRGLGALLVATCMSFAREVGYVRMTLWTHSILENARRIYAREGFRIVRTEDHDSFGPMLTGETWELDLLAAPS